MHLHGLRRWRPLSGRRAMWPYGYRPKSVSVGFSCFLCWLRSLWWCTVPIRWHMRMQRYISAEPLHLPFSLEYLNGQKVFELLLKMIRRLCKVWNSAWANLMSDGSGLKVDCNAVCLLIVTYTLHYVGRYVDRIWTEGLELVWIFEGRGIERSWIALDSVCRNSGG